MLSPELDTVIPDLIGDPAFLFHAENAEGKETQRGSAAMLVDAARKIGRDADNKVPLRFKARI